ncbi:MAG: hypothetical protein ACOY46_02925 [Bacillota bacterium]
MPKSRTRRAAVTIGRMAAGEEIINLSEEILDLSDDELAEALREWETSLESLDSEEIQRQRSEINQLLAEYRRGREVD